MTAAQKLFQFPYENHATMARTTAAVASAWRCPASLKRSISDIADLRLNVPRGAGAVLDAALEEPADDEADDEQQDDIDGKLRTGRDRVDPGARKARVSHPLKSLSRYVTVPPVI